MNVIQIKNLINQIGEFNININKKTGEYILNNDNVLEIEFNRFEDIKTEYDQKLIAQLKQKSDVKLLQAYLKDVLKNINDLENHYHDLRIKLSESNLLDKEGINSVKKTCKIIDAKIIVLEKMQLDLVEKIKYHDYKLDNDFGGEESQSKEKLFEDNELELSGVPKLNLSNRFKLLKSLKIVDVLEELKIDKKQKTILLALTMGINIDNARHLLSNTYPDPPKSKESELENFFIKYKIKI